MVNALPTILGFCTGAAPATGFSASIWFAGVFGWKTFDPSTLHPLPPKKLIIEQFWT